MPHADVSLRLVQGLNMLGLPLARVSSPEVLIASSSRVLLQRLTAWGTSSIVMGEVCRGHESIITYTLELSV